MAKGEEDRAVCGKQSAMEGSNPRDLSDHRGPSPSPSSGSGFQKKQGSSMNISSPFIRRPVATSLLALGVLISGILAYTRLPVAPIPQVEYPVISVNAGLPGASPETMASAVATPLERQFGRIAGVNQMTSTSQLGSTGITLQFDLSRNIDAAARDVQAAINAALGQLPANLPTRPNWRKV